MQEPDFGSLSGFFYVNPIVFVGLLNQVPTFGLL